MSASFVTTIDLQLADKMQQDLIDQGFTMTQPAYTLFSAQKKGVTCTLYASGKLMVQGKEKDEFITFYLEPNILGSVAYSYPETQVDFTARIGIDEAGKGDFFGPLCVAGVQADEAKIKELLALGVRDSKKMSDSTVHKLNKKIKLAVPHAIVRIPPQKYNELYGKFRNLNRLLAWGHATAIAELVDKTGCSEVIIDQFASENVVEEALERKQIKVSLTQRHRGEEDPVVAAASILARAAFLEGLEQLGRAFDVELPKGAANGVITAGQRIVAKHGEQILEKVAKLHFKTTELVLHAGPHS